MHESFYFIKKTLFVHSVQQFIILLNPWRLPVLAVK
jgi:hypothetical protein